jgi:hypothetical protein
VWFAVLPLVGQSSGTPIWVSISSATIACLSLAVTLWRECRQCRKDREEGPRKEAAEYLHRFDASMSSLAIDIITHLTSNEGRKLHPAIYITDRLVRQSLQDLQRRLPTESVTLLTAYKEFWATATAEPFPRAEASAPLQDQPAPPRQKLNSRR